VTRWTTLASTALSSASSTVPAVHQSRRSRERRHTGSSAAKPSIFCSAKMLQQWGNTLTGSAHRGGATEFGLSDELGGGRSAQFLQACSDEHNPARRSSFGSAGLGAGFDAQIDVSMPLARRWASCMI
jgi:hypothetical protein